MLLSIRQIQPTKKKVYYWVHFDFVLSWGFVYWPKMNQSAKFIKLRKEYIITVHITPPTPNLNSPPYRGIFFKNYFILVTKPIKSFIEEAISRSKNIVKARKNNVLLTFQLSVSYFFNKKVFLEVREGTEKARTYKLSTSSFTHIAPHHSSPDNIFMVHNTNDRKHTDPIL